MLGNEKKLIIISVAFGREALRFGNSINLINRFWLRDARVRRLYRRQGEYSTVRTRPEYPGIRFACEIQGMAGKRNGECRRRSCVTENRGM